MDIIRPEAMVLTVSESGLGRLSSPEDYRLQKRGGKGLTNYHVDKFGPVAGVKMVSPEEDVILIAEDGVVIRIPAGDIRQCSRPSKGVRVMRLQEDNRIVTLASAPKEDDEAEESSEQPEQETVETETLPKEQPPEEKPE